MRPNTIEDLMKKVNKTESCWLWTGRKDKDGYAKCCFRNKSGYSLHRLMWELNHGEIPNGLLVCHKCDTPACVRPDHLFLGSVKDNIRDMWRKGRAARQVNPMLYENTRKFGDENSNRKHPEATARGERAGLAKLTASQVLEIRQIKYVPGMSLIEIALKYGVTPQNVRQIILNRTWRHLIPETKEWHATQLRQKLIS